MIGLLQRVTEARVDIGDDTIATIGPGLLVLVGVTADDRPANAERLAQRLIEYRVFADDAGRMNLGLADTGGDLLLVPQFTLAADTRKGRRPGFGGAADPETAANLFHRLLEAARAKHAPVAAGRFGADMRVSLVNDGPVTFWIEG